MARQGDPNLTGLLLDLTRLRSAQAAYESDQNEEMANAMRQRIRHVYFAIRSHCESTGAPLPMDVPKKD